MKKSYRVAVIGATGKGNYGHDIDTAFVDVQRAEIVAVADDNPDGLRKAGDKLNVAKRYADYRKLLDEVRPQIVCLGPGWVSERVAMIQAAAAVGCHIYCEKPFLGDLTSVDQANVACRQGNIKLAMAHQWRAMPPVQKALAQLREGRFGRVLRMRARPKDDARGGGQELLLHGTHWFDLMIAIAGPPRWASGHVAVGSRDVQRSDVRQDLKSVGPMAGDSVVAVFGFDDGVRGFFDSTANTAPNVRKPKPGEITSPAWDSVYSLMVECERATLLWRQPGDVFVYPAPSMLPDIEALKWEKTWVEDWHFTPEHQPRLVAKDWLRFGNQTLAQDLIDAIEQDREPLSPLRHATLIAEMVQGVYASHLADGQRMAIPLADRAHPLTADSVR
jgi:predicted dehydrogenase